MELQSTPRTFLILQETEALNAILTFCQKKAFLVFLETKTSKKFVIFQETKTLKNPTLEKLLVFQNQKFLILVFRYKHTRKFFILFLIKEQNFLN